MFSSQIKGEGLLRVANLPAAAVTQELPTAFAMPERERPLLNGALMELAGRAGEILSRLPKPDLQTLKSEPLATLKGSLQGAYQELFALVNEFGSRIPPLAFHGTNRETGIDSIMKEKSFSSGRGGRGGIRDSCPSEIGGRTHIS